MAADRDIPILIVEDYRDMARLIRQMLQQLGFRNVDEVADGASALEKLRGQRYGLVISDWNMEPMTGLMLLREIRSDPELCDLPFIMVTGAGHLERVAAAKEAGVNDYILKPFTMQTLRRKLAGALGDL